jgi:hypothetical protein
MRLVNVGKGLAVDPETPSPANTPVENPTDYGADCGCKGPGGTHQCKIKATVPQAEKIAHDNVGKIHEAASSKTLDRSTCQ